MNKTKAPFTPAQCKVFIEQYSRQRAQYEELAGVLTSVLKAPAAELGLPAMIQARAKEVSSFAGKIQRPHKNYTDPLNEITDFCGVRIITLTLDGVSRMCQFIEDNFQIYWEHSEDKLDSLGSDTFGYLSAHYIVSFREGDFAEKAIPPHLIGLQAEIQVRTLLQHAWADIAHEFSYKSAVNLPLAWKRELSRLAALLEEGDQAFDRLQHDLFKYTTSYRDHYNDEELAQEVARNEIVLEVDPQNREVAHKLAKLAMTLEDWKKAVDVLSTFGADGTAEMMRDLGVSLCKLRRDDEDSEAYAEGQRWIEAALQRNPQDVDAWASLGGTWRTLERRAKGDKRQECREKARECYRHAFETDASDPYALGNFVEYELVATPKGSVLPYIRPAILTSIQRCEAQAKAGVNLPWAYFSLGEFYLFLGEPLNALRFYTLGVDSCTGGHFVMSPSRSFDLLEESEAVIAGMDWARAFLEVAATLKFGRSTINTKEAADESIATPVVIVAGGSGETDRDRFRDLVLESFSSFQGTVVSGGTEAGIAATIGELGALNGNIHTIGYQPSELPSTVEVDTRYAEHRTVTGQDFSPLEIIQYWKDLVAAGVPADQIRLLAFGGGPLSTLECCIALAMGVSVGIVSSNGEPDRLLEDPYWNAKGAAGQTHLFALNAESDAINSFLRGLPQS